MVKRVHVAVVICFALFAVGHVYVCSRRQPPQPPQPVLQREVRQWEVKSDFYCSKGGSSRLPEDDTKGFGMSAEQCQEKCDDLEECKMYSFGRWEMGLTPKVGGHYGEFRCQHYATCDVKPRTGMSISYKIISYEPVPQPEPLPNAKCVMMDAQSAGVCAFQFVIICVVFARSEWLGMCSILTTVASAVYFGSIMASELPTALLVPLGVIHVINVVSIFIAWRYRSKEGGRTAPYPEDAAPREIGPDGRSQGYPEPETALQPDKHDGQGRGLENHDDNLPQDISEKDTKEMMAVSLQ